jgi:hypothetical protein
VTSLASSGSAGRVRAFRHAFNAAFNRPDRAIEPQNTSTQNPINITPALVFQLASQVNTNEIVLAAAGTKFDLCGVA